jgi:hypothetical protein
MEPESSMRRTVSKVVRKEYGSSGPLLGAVLGVGGVYAGDGPRAGPDAAVGEGV